MLQVGSPNVSEVDLHRLETFESEVLQFKAKAEGGARLAYLALKKSIGLRAGQNFVWTAKNCPPTCGSLRGRRIYAEGLENRPELESLKKGIEARKHWWMRLAPIFIPPFFLRRSGPLRWRRDGRGWPSPIFGMN